MASWLVFSLLSAVMAACVAIFGKMGLQHVDANTATAIRSVIMAVFLVGVITAQGKLSLLPSILSDKRGLLFIVLSGIAGALSWLFYFIAIKQGKVSQVVVIDKMSVVFAVVFAMILLGEKLSLLALCGIGFMVIGALCVALS